MPRVARGDACFALDLVEARTPRSPRPARPPVVLVLVLPFLGDVPAAVAPAAAVLGAPDSPLVLPAFGGCLFGDRPVTAAVAPLGLSPAFPPLRRPGCGGGAGAARSRTTSVPSARLSRMSLSLRSIPFLPPFIDRSWLCRMSAVSPPVEWLVDTLATRDLLLPLPLL